MHIYAYVCITKFDCGISNSSLPSFKSSILQELVNLYSSFKLIFDWITSLKHNSSVKKRQLHLYFYIIFTFNVFSKHFNDL